VVTTPQQVALTDVRKAITFCRQLHLPVLGVLENMSGFVCPHCGKRVDIFNQGGGEVMAGDMDVPFLGRIPIDPDIVQAGDAGKPFIRAFAGSEAARAFAKAIDSMLERLE
jgi:Mrp family chromosome partitioning ATPase